MHTERTTVLSLTLTFLVVAAALPAGTGGPIGTASADDHGDWYTIRQPGAGVCHEVQAFTVDHEKMRPEVEVRGSNEIGDVTGDFRNPDWDGPVTIESIMDYRYRDGDVGQTSYYAPYLNTQYRYEPWEYATYGLYNWSDDDESHMFFYQNAAGEVSLVMRHDRLYEDTGTASHRPYNGIYGNISGDGFLEPSPGGGSVDFEFRNLPDGEWAYLDDMYPRENMDDTYYDAEGNRYGHREAEYEARPLEEFGGGYFDASWEWGSGGTDGGAYRGLHELDDGEQIVIDSEFARGIYEWEVRSNEGDDELNGTMKGLEMNERLVVEPGRTCFDSSLETSPDDTAEAGEEVTLTASAGGTEYQWDFDGDGTVETNTTESEATRAYNETGDLTPTVTIDAGGQTATATTELTVRANESPTAAIDVSEGEGASLPDYHVPGEQLVFDASASEDNVGIAGYEWQLGDGTTRTGDEVITHSYDEPGEYTVSVTVTDRVGNSDTLERTVVVDEPDAEDPEASLDASPTAFEADRTVAFDASDSDDNRAIAEYRWDYDGDGDYEETTSGPEASFDPPYRANGSYEASVVVEDGSGNTDNATVALDVTPAEAPAIESVTANGEVPAEATITAGDGVDLSANATDNVGVTEYAWDVDGDGDYERTTADATLTREFDAGEYDGSVRVSDAAGHTATRGLSIAVDPGPDAEIEANVSEANATDPVRFDASDSTAPSNVTEYRWDFDGDGEPERTTGAGEDVVTHRYGESGNYTATVTIETERGNENEAAVEVTVNEPEERAIDDEDDDASTGGSIGAGGGSSGGGGGGGASPPPIVTEIERAGPNATLVDVRNGRAGETVSADLREATAANATGVRFAGLDVTLGGDDAHVAFETAASADAPGEVSALTASDETLAYLDVGAKYLDAGIENATVAAEVEREALGELRGAGDVALYGYDGTWERLDATVVGETDDGYRLEATTDSLGALAVGADRTVAVADAALAETAVGPEETVAATATLENPAASDRTVPVTFALDGEAVATERVSVPAGETADVTLRADGVEPGTYEATVGGERLAELTVDEGATGPADTAVVDLSLSSSSIETGETVEVTATVENAGGEPGTAELTLSMFGEDLATETVEVPAGERREVTFEQRVDASGSYTVAVNGATAALDVTGEDRPDGEGNPTPDVPGFGVGTAAVALLAAALLARLHK